MTYNEILNKNVEEYEKEINDKNLGFGLNDPFFRNTFLLMISTELANIADELHYKNRNDAARSNYELGLITREEMNSIVISEK